MKKKQTQRTDKSDFNTEKLRFPKRRPKHGNLNTEPQFQET